MVDLQTLSLLLSVNETQMVQDLVSTVMSSPQVSQFMHEHPMFFKNIQEMKITKNDDGSFTYTRETVQRQWDDKMYLFPIPNDVMLKHEKYGAKWEQNPGW